MSKYVKNLEIATLAKKLEGVEDVLFVNMVGVNSGQTQAIRNDLAKKGIKVTVVRNNLAAKVLTDMKLGAGNDLLVGPSAIAWGGSSISQLAKELLEWNKKDKKLELKGAVVQGERYGAEKIEEISKLPTREELIGRIVMLVQSPGARLAAMLSGPGASLASQIKTMSEEKPAEGEAPAAA
jgi:large subunit ribosomal protein L10